MLLKFLEKIGRKRTLLDRGPSHQKFSQAKPWMNRYYLFLKQRPRWFPFNIFIHEMLNNDHGDGVHNHPYPFITIILKGGYLETLEKGVFLRKKGYIGLRSANALHRIDLNIREKTLTLFIAGPLGLRKTNRSSYGHRFQKKIK